jgi:hypothetical protein
MAILKRLPLGLLFLGAAFCFAQENADDQKAQEANTAVWRGVYNYPDGSGQEPVKFTLVTIQNGPTIAGFLREANSFGKQGEPWLHSVIKGTFDKKTGELVFTKTYDGTGGQSHDVQYTGKTAEDGKKFEGTWSLGGAAGGTFELTKVPSTRSGPLAGIWTGVYQYPEGSAQEPVRFNMLVIHDRHGIAGVIKETNTFGNKNEPWLSARVRGKLNEKTGKLTFMKTYDGTAGEEHDVDYSGTVSADKKKVEGTWNLDEKAKGTFTIEKLPVNAKTLEDLR